MYPTIEYMGFWQVFDCTWTTVSSDHVVLLCADTLVALVPKYVLRLVEVHLNAPNITNPTPYALLIKHRKMSSTTRQPKGILVQSVKETHMSKRRAAIRIPT